MGYHSNSGNYQIGRDRTLKNAPRLFRLYSRVALLLIRALHSLFVPTFSVVCHASYLT